MKWPDLVPDSVCTTPITITVQSGLDEDGAPASQILFEGMCNYSEQEREILDADRRALRLQASALIPGDPFPGQSIAGRAVINGGTVIRTIYRSSRARNPDGTVNFTKLELI